MNEWASPWESNPPTPAEVVITKPAPSRSSLTPITATYGFFDAFANEASWGNDEAPIDRLQKAGNGADKRGLGNAASEEWDVPAFEEPAHITRDLIQTHQTSTDEAFIGTEANSDKTISAPALTNNNGLLDIDDDDFFGNSQNAGAPGYTSTENAQKHDLLELMDDDFLRPAPAPFTVEPKSFDDTHEHEDTVSAESATHVNEREIEPQLSIIGSLQANHDLLNKSEVHLIGTPKPALEEKLEVKDTDSVGTTIFEPAGEVPQSMSHDQDYSITDETTSIASRHASPVAEEEEFDTVDLDKAVGQNNVDDSAVISQYEKEIAAEDQLEEIVADGKHVVEPQRLDTLLQDEIVHDVEHDYDATNTVMNKSSELNAHGYLDIEGHEATAPGHGVQEQLEHSSNNPSNDNRYLDGRESSFPPSINDVHPPLQNNEDSPIMISEKAPDDMTDTEHNANISYDFGDFGEFESSLKPDLTSSEDQEPETTIFMTEGNDRNNVGVTTNTAAELGSMMPDISDLDNDRTDTDGLTIDNFGDTGPLFQVDKSTLPNIFPTLSLVPDDPPPEPDDEQINSTSVRKTWYRLSRQSSMRYYNSADFDNYVRVMWPGSAIQAKVTDIVTKWVAADRQSGGSIFKATFKPQKPSGVLLKHPDEHDNLIEAPRSASDMHISIPKPPRSPTGFGWSSATPPISINAIPAPPTSNGLLTPRVSTPLQGLHAPDPIRSSTPIPTIPAQIPPPDEIDAEDDDDFGVFMSSASPMRAEPVQNHREGDFDDWLSPSSDALEAIASSSIIERNNDIGPAITEFESNIFEMPAPQVDSEAQSHNDLDDLFSQPLTPRQTSSPLPKQPFSPESISVFTSADERLNTPISFPHTEPENQNDTSSALAKPPDVSNSPESPASTTPNVIASPQASKVNANPDWFNTPLVLSKPQTPVSANRSVSLAHASFVVDDWFDAPSTSHSPIHIPPPNPISSTEDPNLKFDDSFNTTTIPLQSQSNTIIPPPTSTNQPIQGFNDWLDNASASSQDNQPSKSFGTPPQISLSHPSTPFNPSPFLPPPPRPHSALPEITSSFSSSASKQKSLSAYSAAVSSPLASHSHSWTAKEESAAVDDDGFDDDFGGFVSSPPSGVAPPSGVSASVDHGWDMAEPAHNAISDILQPTQYSIPTTWEPLPTTYSTPPPPPPPPTTTSTSAFNDLDSAFDFSFCDTPAPPPPTTTTKPLILEPPRSVSSHFPQSPPMLAPPPPPYLPFPTTTAISANTATAINHKTPTLPTFADNFDSAWDAEGDDGGFSSFASNVNNTSATSAVVGAVKDETEDVDVDGDGDDDGIDRGLVEEVIRGLPNWSWIL